MEDKWIWDKAKILTSQDTNFSGQADVDSRVSKMPREAGEMGEVMEKTLPPVCPFRILLADHRQQEAPQTLRKNLASCSFQGL